MITLLKFYRLIKNIKVSDLARKVSVSTALISKIENGRCQGSQRVRLKIAKALGVSEEILFGIK